MYKISRLYVYPMIVKLALRNAHAPYHVSYKWSLRKPHIWNPRPQFAYSLFNFYGATMTIKGSLLVSVPIVKRFLTQRMRRITWPISRGSLETTYLESPTPLCLFTI